MALREIEIDWDIHKLVEAERRGFDEPPHRALRRLLGLEDTGTPPPPAIGEGLPWSEDGVVIPHGALAKMEYDYGRQVYEGAFLNGKLVVNGHRFDSLSEAARALATTRAGHKTQLNGWVYWQVKLPGEHSWRRLGEMRAALRRK